MFDGQVDNDDETTEPGESTTVGLTGEREESGRGQEPMEVDVKAEVTVNGEQLEDEVSIEQIEGDPAYNVVRQEYEDVTGDVGVSGRDDAVTMPSAEIFQEGTTNFPHALGTSIVPSLPNPNDNYDWYILNPNIIPGLENAHDWAQNNRNFDVQYNYNSEYRSPTHNRGIPGTGTGNSKHIYGTAVDFQVRFSGGGLVQNYAANLYPNRYNSNDQNASAKAFERLIKTQGSAVECLLEPSIGNLNVTKERAHCEW